MIFRFELLTSVANGVHSECTPLEYEIELVNLNEQFPTGPSTSVELWGGPCASGFEGQIQLFDVSGKLMLAEQVLMDSGEQHLLDLSNLPVGFYSCKVLQDGKPVFTGKIIISR